MLGLLKGIFGGNTVNAKEMIKNGALVIDVREKDEWDGGHLPMAKHLPVGEVAARMKDVEQWAGGDKTKPIVVYCASGGRSGRAQAQLANAGFTNVVNGGGYSSLR
jgi:phage shock protein E